MVVTPFCSRSRRVSRRNNLLDCDVRHVASYCKNAVKQLLSYIEEDDGSNEPAGIHGQTATEGVARAESPFRAMLLGGLQQVKDSTARYASIHRHRGRGSVLRMDRLDVEETA